MMKYVMRRGCFETNSSSMHTIAIMHDKDYTDYDDLNSLEKQDGVIIVHTHFYGSEVRMLRTLSEKLEYVASYHVHDERLTEEIRRYINKKTGCPCRIIPGEEIEENYVGIDHQSREVLRDFLVSKYMGIEDFLDNPRYFIVTMNDCDIIFEEYQNLGIADKVDAVYYGYDETQTIGELKEYYDDYQERIKRNKV